MSNVASLEVYRPILLVRESEEPVDRAQSSDFLEKAATMARLLLDQNGKSSVTLRTDNVVRPTIVQHTRVYPRLRYVHARTAGDDVKHMSKKMVAARSLMEDGRATRGIRPLATILGRLAETGYGVDDNTLFYDLELGRTDIVSQETRDGTKLFVVLRPGERDASSWTAPPGFVESMLKSMSAVTTDFIMSHASNRLHAAVIPAISDSVPIARLDTNDPSKAELLASHISELLPLTVSVSSEVSFESNY